MTKSRLLSMEKDSNTSSLSRLRGVPTFVPYILTCFTGILIALPFHEIPRWFITWMALCRSKFLSMKQLLLKIFLSQKWEISLTKIQPIFTSVTILGVQYHRACCNITSKVKIQWLRLASPATKEKAQCLGVPWILELTYFSFGCVTLTCLQSDPESH